MPRAERNKKAAAKSLAKAAAQPGQSKLTSLFSRTSNLEVSTYNEEIREETHAEVINDDFETLSTEETWVKIACEFTDKDRTNSEKNGRFFLAEWFGKHDWLAYHREKKKAFCSTCTANCDTQRGVFNFKYGEGFNTWKKATEKFKEHEDSFTHKNACAATASGNAAKRSIAATLSSQILEQQELRRQGLLSHFRTLKTLLRQGVAIRGKTDIESNIYQFDLDKSANDKGLQLLLNEKRYTTAHDILDEQERMLVLKARRELLGGVLEKDFYSILADESSDVSKKEQLSFCVRTCTDEYEVSEDFIGIFECVEGLSSDALLKYTKDILLRSCLDGNNLAAMGFDGAAAMKSLARKLKVEISPNAVYVHCFAHCNELIVKDAIDQCSLLSTSLDLCQSLYAIVGAYPKRILLFEAIQNDFKHENESDEYTVLRLQSLSATRWTTRVKAANVVFEKTVEVRRTLETLASDPSISADTKARIKGILKHQLSSLHIMFNLNVARKLIVLLEKFSKELQAVDISADYALYSVQHILQRLHEMRDNKEFQRILDEAKSISGIEEANTDGARKRKVPRWMESGDSMLTETLHTTGTVHSGSIGDMRQSYFEAIDVIVESINRRFEQEDLTLIKTIEQILLRSMIERGYPIDTLEHALIN